MQALGYPHFMEKTELQELENRLQAAHQKEAECAREPGLSDLKSLCSEPLRYAALIGCERSGLHIVNTPEVFIFQGLQSACCMPSTVLKAL